MEIKQFYINEKSTLKMQIFYLLFVFSFMSLQVMLLTEAFNK